MGIHTFQMELFPIELYVYALINALLILLIRTILTMPLATGWSTFFIYNNNNNNNYKYTLDTVLHSNHKAFFFAVTSCTPLSFICIEFYVRYCDKASLQVVDPSREPGQLLKFCVKLQCLHCSLKNCYSFVAFFKGRKHIAINSLSPNIKGVPIYLFIYVYISFYVLTVLRIQMT